VFIPICYQIIEAATPKLISFLSDNDSQFDVKPTDIKEGADRRQHQEVIPETVRAREVWAEVRSVCIKQLLMYGTSYFFVDWKVRYAWVWERVPQTTIKHVRPGNRRQSPRPKYVDQKSYKIVERRPEIDVPGYLGRVPRAGLSPPLTTNRVFSSGGL
jgi:hypothetical protein